MANTIVSKILIRQGALNEMPMLTPGEFGLATDEQRLFLGQAPVVGNIYYTNSTNVAAEVSFNTLLDGRTSELDLDFVNQYMVEVYDSVNNTTTALPPSASAVNDSRLTVAHGLGRELQVIETLYGAAGTQSYEIAQLLNLSSWEIHSLTVDGTVYTETTDWTISGQFITFITPIFAGAEVILITIRAKDTFTLYYNKEVSDNRNEIENRIQSIYLTKQQSPGIPEYTNIDFLAEVKSYIDMEYYMYTPLGHRNGHLRIGIHDVALGVFTITDEFTNTTATDDLTFSMQYESGVFKLYYDTTYLAEIQMSFAQRSFRRLTS